MRKRLSLVCLAVAIFAILFADAHNVQAQLPSAGVQLTEPGTVRRVGADLNLGVPGRVWFETNVADQGLGFEGSYFTLGAKNRLFEDALDGRWLGEARFHHGFEDEGGFFANIGIERVFSVKAAKADIVTGFWYDFDSDQTLLNNSFNQVGVHAAIKTRNWDLLGNGYFPVGDTDVSTGTGFVGSNIVLQQGFDSALQGFDVTLRTRPEILAFGNGVFDIGGYGYSSDLVDSVGGGRVRVGFQGQRGFHVLAELNHDDRFDTTGVLTVGYTFGTRNARGDAGVGLARDLEETLRNDHIVRFSESPVLAIDPETGLAFNVIHVNNTADGALGNGTAENPFSNLADAEANSGFADVIVVDVGDGTSTGLDTGIVLQDYQRLFGSGGDILLGLDDGTFFELPGAADGPTLSNAGGINVITLADSNTIQNINVDGAGAVNGIGGDGFNNTTIIDVNVAGADGNGAAVTNFTGDLLIDQSSFSGNTLDGLSIVGVSDPNSTITLSNSTFDDNGTDGIQISQVQTPTINLTSNTTSNNGSDGLRIDQQVGSIAGVDIDIIGHTTIGNTGNGIIIEDGDGDLNIVDTIATDNALAGLLVRNFENDPNAPGGEATFIGSTDGGVSNFLNNGGTGIEIDIDVAALGQDVLITGVTSDGNGTGILASVDGIASTLDLEIVDNLSVSNNDADGIQLLALNSGEVNALIENDAAGAALSVFDNNDIASGAGISLFTDTAAGPPNSEINAIVRNVDVNNDFEMGTAVTFAAAPVGRTGISVNGLNASQVNLLVEDSTIEAPTAFDIDFDNAGNSDVNNVFLNNLVVRGDTPLTLDVQGGSEVDFSLTNSDIQSNGTINTPDALPSDGAETGDPFSDAAGDTGLVLNINGDAPGELTLTRIEFSNNLIRDFTFEAFTLNTTGDAQVVASIIGNQFLNNGPGIDDLIEFPDDPTTVSPGGDSPVNPNELNFLDTIVFNSLGTSSISARLEANQILGNFDQGVEFNAAGASTISASLAFNTLANDIGVDGDGAPPPAFLSDFDVNNFGPASNVNLELTNNSFLSGVQFVNNGAGIITLELDGLTNGITDADFAGVAGINTASFGLTEGLISADELFFENTGAPTVDADTPLGGAFAPIP